MTGQRGEAFHDRQKIYCAWLTHFPPILRVIRQIWIEQKGASMDVRTIVRTCALLGVMALICTVSVTCLAQRSPAAASASAQRYKGIFEPMNYPDDVTINDAFFVNDQVGWVSGRGAGGMLLHTADGGQHWNLQLGDPKSSEAEIKDLHFLDATHGWARQGGNFLRTTDGTNWQVVGTYPGDFGRYTFTSPNDGFESFGP